MRSLVLHLNDAITARFGPASVKYAVTSVISVLITQAILFLLFGVMRVFSAVTSNVVATAVAAIPSYYLNRRWAWGKSGRSHLLKEVIPFWALAFIGLWVSIETVAWTQARASAAHVGHLTDAVLINLASLVAFGVVWVGKYVIFSRFMFGTPRVPDPVA
ncbi:conserved hypothetical protein [Acidimicrobium ferrooxidans DSM 10331]|uniref:GtrA/DPMS transmembrane domain-containing protein n=1 Tax=Acidimicrobium ferrooxidans (strain DSM 10331 / JCM 15462 / NBRC 103882 / ICP) TaxID=525909 RepID=C7M199_ACIFD|nr:GtrA family protein [Acidimicrobium ferrooxidans]ACU54747.1 conserved hypothetical protein [Acidimicrobium ferrooxidans DSM 10331]